MSELRPQDTAIYSETRSLRIVPAGKPNLVLQLPNLTQIVPVYHQYGIGMNWVPKDQPKDRFRDLIPS